MKPPGTQLHSPADHELLRFRLAKDVQLDIQAVRVIAAAMVDPAEAGSIEAVAGRLGYSVAQVSKVIGSDNYRAIVRESMLGTIMPAMAKGVSICEDIMANGKRDADRISAVKALGQLYAIVQGNKESHKVDDSQAALEQFLAALDVSNSLNRVLEPIPAAVITVEPVL